jgi:hypothetical protein
MLLGHHVGIIEDKQSECSVGLNGMTVLLIFMKGRQLESS